VFTLLFLNQPWTWIIILAVILLLFGATRLPALAKSLGQSARVLRKELKADDTEGAATSTEGDTPADKK
jgi:sec-independent protein translocase protein TatA